MVRTPQRSAVEKGRPALHALAAIALLFVFAGPAHGSVSVFTNTGSVCTVLSPCWQAGDFGVLVGLRDATNSWGTSTVNYTTGASSNVGADVNGEIGVGSGSKLVFNAGNQNRTWDGPIDFADALNSTSGTCGAGSCAVPSGNTLTRGSNKITVNGGTAQATSQITTAMNQMRDISVYWADAARNPTTLTSLATASNNSFSGSGTHVYKIASNTLINTTNTLTLTGDATSLFVFNIYSATSNTTIPMQWKNNIQLNGITSDQVFFNILGQATGSANYVFAATAGTLRGTFYVAADTYNVNTTFASARLMGGKGTSAWGSSFVLNGPSDVPDGTPEPSTYVLMGAGLGALAYVRSRRTR